MHSRGLLFFKYYINSYKHKKQQHMTFKKLQLITLLFLLTSVSTNAQFWKKLKDKATQKVEQKVDKETDKMLDKAIDGNPEKAKKSQQTSSYIFTGSVTLEVTSNGETANFSVLFNKSKEVFCMHMNAGDGQNIYNVISPKGGVVFMNASGMKIKKSLPSDQFSHLDYADKIPKKSEFTKTGSSKTILGYFCEEYQYKNEGSTVSAWVTKNFPITSKYAPMLGMTKDSAIKGFTLELAYKTQNGEEANVKVTKIDKNKKVVLNATEYTSM